MSDSYIRPLHILRPSSRRYPMTQNPKGWYVLLRAAELRRGQVRRLRHFGQDIVAFRGKDGRARLVGPYCPHLGAHLGYGGKVRGNEIVCPYHHWRFSGDGRCTHVPGVGSPPRTGLPCWPTLERNGLIYTYYDPAGQDPDFDVPEIEEWTSPSWVKYSELTYRTGGHVLELQENLLDEAHFVTIHRRLEPLVWDFEPRGRLARATAQMKVGTKRWHTLFDVSADFIGPGMIILRTRGLIEHTVLSLGTPVDETTSLYRILFLTKKPKLLGASANLMNFCLRRYARIDFMKEARIWEQRQYPTRPVYMRGDRSIPKYRKWYRQFYSEQELSAPMVPLLPEVAAAGATQVNGVE